MDARGEADLREAHSSTLAVIAWFPNQEGRLPEVQQLIEAHSGPYFLENKPGHQLVSRSDIFSSSVRWISCYLPISMHSL